MFRGVERSPKMDDDDGCNLPMEKSKSDELEYALYPQESSIEKYRYKNK